jgi:hypothetical protein
MSRYTILFLIFTGILLSDPDSTESTPTDYTVNRLFLTSTGYVQPQGVFGIQVHEFVGLQALYSPMYRLQFNFGYSNAVGFVAGTKIQIFDNPTFFRSLSLTFDATFIKENDIYKNKYLIPGISATLGFDVLQISGAIHASAIERFVYIPIPKEEQYMTYGSGRYFGRGTFFKIPSVIQVGLMHQSKLHRLKIIAEIHIEYSGKFLGYYTKYTTIGFKKYWRDSYLDFAFITYFERISDDRTDSTTIPYLSFGFFL